MANKFTVDTQEMQQTTAFLKKASSDYSRIYTQLLSVASSMGAAYSSADNAAFVEKIQSCSGDLKSMAQRLEAAADILDKQRANYERQMEENLSAVQRL